MKAYKIDARLHLVTEEVHTGDLEEVARIGGFDRVDLIPLASGDTLLVDEVGRLKNPTDYFSVPDYARPLAGNGVVLGFDDDGNETEPKITLDELKRRIRFWKLIGDTLHPV